MEDIELVVKIPKEIYNHTQEYEIGGFNQENDTKLFIAIKNGTPLPKGHGKMIDAVSRASVFEIMGNLMSIPYDFDRTITEKDVSESMDEIRALPPVTPTRKKGKWLSNSDFPDEISCSCCNNNYDMWYWEQGTMNYCPNCGSYMKREFE